MLVTSDMYTLINYVGFINYLFYGVTVAGQIVLRWKKPDMVRPIKVSRIDKSCYLYTWKPQLHGQFLNASFYHLLPER